MHRQRPTEDGMSKDRNQADVAFIEALAELLNRNDLTEINVKREYGENDSLNVRVSKHAAPVQMIGAPLAAPSAPSPAPASAAPRADAPIDDPAQHPGALTSPMVGTAYLAPEPGAAAFVSVGSTVAEGQTLLIIEAMKTMNQIPSPRAGVVKRILVADGSPVEYGAPLMIIE
jgi:acetyl-CoA carboxylase biotin carboxyl carrier protein